MIQKALQYLVGLKENKTYQINGKTYSDHKLELIEDERYYRREVEFSSLDAIVKMIKTEIKDYTGPVFIRIKDHKNVDVFTRPDDREHRLWPYSATCVDAEFKAGWRSQDEAIIEIRSRFIPTDDSEYLINLISRINSDNGVQTQDNGVSQTVVVKQGVTLMGQEVVRPRLMLQPFRTFREIPQPVSEFILRLDENGRVGLFEADGGIWKMEAKDSIKAYLAENLSFEVTNGFVIIIV